MRIVFINTGGWLQLIDEEGRPHTGQLVLGDDGTITLAERAGVTVPEEASGDAA